jgi:hypothetical protein
LNALLDASFRTIERVDIKPYSLDGRRNQPRNLLRRASVAGACLRRLKAPDDEATLTAGIARPATQYGHYAYRRIRAMLVAEEARGGWKN